MFIGAGTFVALVALCPSLSSQAEAAAPPRSTSGASTSPPANAPAKGAADSTATRSSRESAGPRDDAVPRRLLARYDFEENAIFPREIPTGFYRALAREDVDLKGTRAPQGAEQGIPGLRHFGRIEAVRGVGRAPAKGDPGWAVRFTVDGASMMLATEPSKVAVMPGAQLVVRGWVRSEGLQAANMRLSVRFYDKDGRGIDEAYSSGPFRSEGVWRMLAVEPPSAPPGAAGISLWLEVVQPSTVRDLDEPYQVTNDDVQGFAYFDDIEIWQVPTVMFEAESGGVVTPGTRPRLGLRCSDPTVNRSTAVVTVRDANDALVYQGSVEVPGDRATVLELPALATGWYEASASFQQGSSEISRRQARFTVLPDEPFEPAEVPRFGTCFAVNNQSILPAVELSRSAFVVVPVWTAQTDVRDTKGEVESLRQVLSKLLDERVTPVFRIAQVPAGLARQNRVDIDDALALFALDDTHWRASLEPWLLAFGQQVDRWIIGNAPTDAARGDIAARVQALAAAMRTAIAGPSVGLPWSPSEQLSDELRQTINRDRHMLEVVVDPAWRNGAGDVYDGLLAGPRGLARIQPMEPGILDDRARAIDLALRGIDAWRAGFDLIATEVRRDGVQGLPGPPIELAAWRQLSLKLSGRRFAAEIPIAPNVRCVLANGARGPVLVAWSGLADGSVEVAADLGSSSIWVTDLWGRSSKVSLGPRGHVFKIGREPVFIEGVDAALCQLRGGLRIDPPSALCRRAPQEGALVLSNPWPTAMSGTVTILGPERLEMTPRSQGFTIPAGGDARLPIVFSVPRTTPAGTETITALIQGNATEPFRATIEAPLKLGSPSIKLDPEWRLARSIESGSVDVVLTLRVSNTGTEPLDVEAFAVADGYTQSRKPISALQPGAVAVRVFHFSGGARRLSGRDIRAGIHDQTIDARTLIRVPIPPLLPPLNAQTTTAGPSLDLEPD